MNRIVLSAYFAVLALLFVFSEVKAQAPSFTSTPLTSAAENVLYTYGILAEDHCNDDLTFAATTLPSWLTFSADGQNSAIKFGGGVASPVGVAGDANGNVYVAAQTGTAIYKITPDGTTTHWADRRGNGTSYGLYAHGDYLYIGYYQNTAGSIGRVALNNPGAGETQIYSSNGEANDLRGAVLSMVERNGYLYVALYYPNKVIKIDLSDPHFGVSSVINSGLNGPFGLGFAANGDLYVANWTGQRLHKWNGTTLVEVISPSDVSNSQISDVKVDKKGNVYISIYGIGVRKYKPDFSRFEVMKAGTSTWGMTITPTQALIFGDSDNNIYKVQTGATIFGTPGHADVGVHPVVLTVSDGDHTVQQAFNITVTDPNKPTVTTYSPANSATNIAFDANLSLTFNETIKKGTGNITIRNASGNAVIEQIDIASERISISGSTLTIDPAADLPGMTTAYVEIAATAILDASNNAYLGISNTSTWTFQTKKSVGQLTFAAAAATATYGDADFVPAASSNNSAIAITYTSSEPTVASIVDGKIHVLKPGTTVITASQASDANFEAPADKTQTLTISPKTLLIVLNASPLITKTYDGTTTATLAAGNYTLTGVLAGDVVSVSGTASYNSNSAGVNKTVNVTNLALAGSQKDNYILAATTGSTTGTISAKPLTVALNASPLISKIYDGNTAATLVAANYSLSGIEGGDDVSASGTASYNTKDAGTKTITATNITLQGAQKNNYTLTSNTAATSGSIAPRVLTVSAEDKSRLQGTANPAFTIRYSGFVNGENEAVLSTLPAAGSTALTSSPTGNYPITVSGGAALNYSFNYIAGTLKVNPGGPDDISLAPVLVYENQAAGTKAGELSSVSGDPNATFTYILVSGSGSTDNALFVISGTELRTLAALDYEQKATYSIRVRSTTQQGLYMDKAFTVSIQDVNEAPTLSAIPNREICFTTAAQSISLSGISAGPESGQTTRLSVSSNSTLFDELSISGNTLNFRVKEGESGSAIVTVTISDDGGTANGGTDTYSRSFTITVNPLPAATILSPATEISKGGVLVLTAAGGSTYQWDDAAGIVNGQNSANLTIRPEQTTTYRVAVRSAEGCVSYQEITISVKEDYVMVDGTNILSPNGDGINDNFIIKNLDMYPDNEVKIFDRAGRLIYSKVNYTNEWTGTFQGSPLAEGAYYYIVDFGQGKPKLKGFITIVKD